MSKGYLCYSVERQPVVVVGTPGKLMDHAMEGTMASWGVRQHVIQPKVLFHISLYLVDCSPSLLLI